MSAIDEVAELHHWRARAERAEAQVETLQGELETATANFHGYVELLERADAAEAQVTALRALLRDCDEELICVAQNDKRGNWGDVPGGHCCSHCDDIVDRNGPLRLRIRAELNR